MRDWDVCPGNAPVHQESYSKRAEHTQGKMTAGLNMVLKASLVAQQVMLPSVMLGSRIGAPVRILAIPLPAHPPTNAPGNLAEADRSHWTSTTHMGALDGPQPDLSLAQPWLLKPSGE